MAAKREWVVRKPSFASAVGSRMSDTFGDFDSLLPQRAGGVRGYDNDLAGPAISRRAQRGEDVGVFAAAAEKPDLRSRQVSSSPTVSCSGVHVIVGADWRELRQTDKDIFCGDDGSRRSRLQMRLSQSRRSAHGSAQTGPRIPSWSSAVSLRRSSLPKTQTWSLILSGRQHPQALYMFYFCSLLSHETPIRNQ